MKKFWLVFVLLSFFFTSKLIAQEKIIEGDWKGALQVGTELAIVFHFSQNKDLTWQGSMDSPDQNAFGLKADSISVKGNEVFISLSKFRIEFRGMAVNDSTITGNFLQAGHKIPLELKKSAEPLKEVSRAQTPRPPYPYFSQDVIFQGNKTGLTYGATYTRPLFDSTVTYKRQPVFPTIIFITGSGQQDRDETIFGHKSFAIIADYLARQGFASLRIDDRGIGSSSGRFDTSTTLDFSYDVEAAMDYLEKRPDVDKTKIGLLGHSEGGLIAPMVASRRKEVGYLILLAGPGINSVNLLAEQNAALYMQNGVSEAAAKSYQSLFAAIANETLKNKKQEKLEDEVKEIVEDWEAADAIKKEFKLDKKEDRENFVKAILPALSQKWMHYFLQQDPALYVSKLKIPVLALNGSKDVQVLPTSNTSGLTQALIKSKSPTYVVKILPGLNHLFQECKDCTIAEYSTLSQSFSPVALQEIGNWLKENVK